MRQSLSDNRFLLLGGDKREEFLLSFLVEQGAELTVLADNIQSLNSVNENIKIINSLDEIINLDFDVVISPMTGVDNKLYIKKTFVESSIQLNEKFFAKIAGSKFLIGFAKDKIKTWCKKYNIDLIEMAADDQLAILNAIPTAEAAISLAIEASDKTLYQNNSFVLGLGRVGLTLARRLHNLGSRSYGVARKYRDLARAEEMGLFAINFRDLINKIKQADFIFNTVPVTVLDKQMLKEVSSDAVIIDLASEPGGTDFKAAKKLGITAELALGLPGKTAPESAGKIIAKIIPRLIEED